MHLSFTPKHVRLISACYPPQPTFPGPGPNPQQLSCLFHYASTKPRRVSKLAADLDRRVKREARRGQVADVCARAYGPPPFNHSIRPLVHQWHFIRTILITLSIHKSLVNECRRDVSQLSAALISSVNTALKALPSDLELATNAANVVRWVRRS